MTSKFICPICKKELEQVGTSRQYQCGSWGCDLSFNMIGTKELWKSLIQAQYDLEIAKKGLHRVITKTNSQVVRGFEYIATGIVKVAKDTLKQIEHKDK